LASLVPLLKEKINIQSLVWAEKFELKPVAFSIKKLVISAT